MHPTQLLLAHRSTLHAHSTSVSVRFFHIMYSFMSPIGGPNISMCLAYFHPNRLFTVLYKQEMEIRWGKDAATLKSKQTSIATVRKHLRTVASLPTPLPFHYPLPLTGLHRTETEICWRKDDGNIKKKTDIDRHVPKPSSDSSQPTDPPPFSLPTTFNWASQNGNGNMLKKRHGNIKKQTDIDRHGPKPSSDSSQPPDPPHFSLPTTFNSCCLIKWTRS